MPESTLKAFTTLWHSYKCRSSQCCEESVNNHERNKCRQWSESRSSAVNATSSQFRIANPPTS
eukprot:1167388-Amphidinium_carterae.1